MSWEVHDTWTEVLVGTRFVLDRLKDQGLDKISKRSLARVAFTSSYQLAEVMFFRRLVGARDSGALSAATTTELRKALNSCIPFSRARRDWPQKIKSVPLPLSNEPFASLTVLEEMRHAAVHCDAKTPPAALAESAYYTAIQASRAFFEFFEGKPWENSEYDGFTRRYPAATNIYLKELQASITLGRQE